MTNTTLGPGTTMSTSAATPKASSCERETIGPVSLRRSTEATGYRRRLEGSDQQTRALAGDPGHHDGGVLLAVQGQALAEVVGNDVDTALLDGEPPDAARPERRLELLLLVRQLL